MAAVIASFAVLATVFVPITAVNAAGGPAVLTVDMEPVDYLTGDPQSAAAYGAHGNKLAYKVSFSCAVANCLGATVQLTPSQADPYGLAAQATRVGKTLLQYSTWTQPAGLPGATITGDDATGKIVSLGDLSSGDSGTFLIVFDIAPTGTYATARAAQFYPSGFQIEMGATFDATNSQAAALKDAAAVTWSSTVPEPGIAHGNSGTVRPGVDTGFPIYMSSGSFPRRDGSSITGRSDVVAAGSYVVVETLAPQAVYVGSTYGGVYDPVAHTVTWTMGSLAAPEYFAAGGWGHNGGSGWVGRDGYAGRGVSVNYPASNFPAADANGCNFEATVTNSVTTTVTYLDDARTVKQASSSASHLVACYDPFGKGTAVKDTTNNGGTATVRNVTVPADGGPDNQYYWSVYANNGGNVPGVAVIDDVLDQADAPVWAIRTSQAATIEWTLNTAVTGTTTGTAVDAPAGTWFTHAKVTSTPLAPVNIRPSDTGTSNFYARFYYKVSDTAPVGETRTNTATATMTYPAYPELTDVALGGVTRSIRFIAAGVPPLPAPRFAASFPAAAQVEGGGLAVPGRNVIFSVTSGTANIPADVDITPQYFFIAPLGWKITEGSASFPSGSVPAGVTFDYTSKTISGVVRDVVIASWPNAVTFGANGVWPTMSVTARATSAVSAGTTSVATAWMGDSRHTWDNTGAVYGYPVVDAPDIDSDGVTTEWFSSANQNVLVSSSDSLSVTKEICLPDLASPDGCDWISDPTTLVSVPTTATAIKYRVTLENTGNTQLGSVVAYDVLPYIGDTGTSAATVGTQRGSTFAEVLDTVSDVSANLTLDYSASTNPTRPQVYPGAPGAVNDWGPGIPGKQAIRATVTGAMAPGATTAFTYTANISAGATADSKACNSVAVDSDKTLPAEPSPVCATTQEADLRLTVPNRLPLQMDRPGVLPFTVTNLGGSAQAPASVTVQIPLGMTVTDLTPSGWNCTADPASSAPIVGPADLICAPVKADATPRTLAMNVPDPLNIAVVPTVGASLCVPAVVSGMFSDPVMSNNDAQGCFVVAAAGGVGITKSDGLSWVSPGQQYTYTLTVSNQLVAEALTGAAVTDTLPAGVAFVSASGGGVVSAQGAADADGNRPGGTVTWSLPALQPTGVPNSAGDGATGGTGTTRTVTVTVKALPDVSGTVVNTAQVSAPDPADSTQTLTDDDTDTDVVRTFAVSKTASAATAKPGDTVTYSVTVTNPTSTDYTAADPVSFQDELAGVLDDAVYNNDASGGATFSGHVLSWSGPLAGGASVTITYSVTVDSPDRGDHLLDNVVTTPADGSCATGSSAAKCATSTPVQSFRVVKSSPSTVVTPGDMVEFTITVTNTGQVPYTAADPASFVDDLSDVLDDAAYDGNATGGATYTDPVLSWSGALAIGASATITYSITIDDPNTGDNQLSNTVVTPVASGGNCAVTSTDPACSVQVPARSYSVAKTTSASVVNPGATVGYTITVTNTGAVDYTTGDPASFSDSLANVLDDASYDGNITGGASVAAGVVSWSGALAVGESRTFTYSVTVADPVSGDQALVNRALTPAGAGGSCTVDSTDPDCGTRTVVRSYTVTKSASASSVLAGGILEYEVVVTNTGLAAYTSANPASFVDDLSAVLDDATYNNDADQGASYTAPEVSWAGALALGGAVTVTYSVTAEQPDAGDRLLNNSVFTAAGTGGDCAIGSTSATCSTSTPVQAFQVKKTASSDRASSGDTVVYTVTVTNTGLVDYSSGAPAGFRDDLSEVLDDARYNDDAVSDGGGDLSYTAPELAWTGALPVGETTAVTYSVTVTRVADGDDRMLNTITTGAGGQLTTLGGNCLAGSDSELCWAQTSIDRPSPALAFTGSAPLRTILMGLLAILVGVAAMGVSRLRLRQSHS